MVKHTLYIPPIAILATMLLTQLNLLPTIHHWVHDIPHIDKLGHFILFSGLTFTLILLLRKYKTRILAALFLLSLIDEGIQHWLDYRFFDPIDWLADIFGIASASLIALRSSQRKWYKKILHLNFVFQSTFNKLLSFRNLIIERFFDISSKVYLKYARQKRTPWRLSKNELLTYPVHSLGFHLGEFLNHQGFNLQARAESHDIFHILTQIGTSVKDEIGLQFFLLGNGKRSLYLFLAITGGVLLMPDYLSFFIRNYKKGKQYQPFYHWDFLPLLHHPILCIQEIIQPQKK